MNRHDSRIQLVNSYLDRAQLPSDLIQYYKGRMIMVTGGAGAIGSNLAIALSRLVGPNGAIFVLDNLSAIKGGNPWNLPALRNVLFVLGDVRDDISLKRMFREGPSIVFHLAAFFANQNSVDYPEEAAEVDIKGIIKLLDYSQLSEVERFVYASSGCSIYGSQTELPLTEDFISMDLSSPYQINKMAGEMYCNFYRHYYGLDTVNCRFFNSYGPGEVPGQYRNVIPNFIFRAMSGLPLFITGSGDETRDFTYVLDLVQGLLKAGYVDSAVGKAFNLASGRETSIKHLADLIKTATGNKQPLKFLPRRKWDTKPRLLASIDLAKQLIDYDPIVGFEEGLSENIRWFEENWEQIKESSDFPPGMSSAVREGGAPSK